MDKLKNVANAIVDKMDKQDEKRNYEKVEKSKMKLKHTILKCG